MNGVGYEVVHAGDSLTFACFTAANWSLSYPMHVVFTPVASVVTGTVMPLTTRRVADLLPCAAGKIPAMSPRGLRVVPVVLLLALAFVLGSVSTATASSLTKGAVKKIAAKVVAKQAPTLSVKHAASADTAVTAQTAANADKVGGVTAQQLGVRPLVFITDTGTFGHEAALTLPGIPAGSYLVTFNVADGNSATWLSCTVRNTTTTKIAATNAQPQVGPFIPLVSGTGLLSVATGDVIRLFCDSDEDIAVTDDLPWTVVLTPVASQTTTTMVPIP